jgi:hypothetical protein
MDKIEPTIYERPERVKFIPWWLAIYIVMLAALAYGLYETYLLLAPHLPAITHFIYVHWRELNNMKVPNGN